MRPEQSFDGCSTHVSLLRAEVKAWTAYWDAAIEKTLPQTEIAPLKQSAYGTSAALKIHAESCPACEKFERRRWFWAEDKDEPISIKRCTDSGVVPGVVLPDTLAKMIENNQNEIETSQLHADALQARLQSVQSQLALGLTLCKMAKTEINFGEIEQARKIMSKVRHSSDTIRYHLAEPDHLPQPKADLYDQLTELETNIGEVETLLRQKGATETPAKP